MKNYPSAYQNNEENYPSYSRNYYDQYNDQKSSQSNRRIQEIKKKYDTPNRRQKIQSLRKSKEFQMKQNYSYGRVQPNSASSNPLKQSFAINRMQKNYIKNETDPKQFVTLKPNNLQKSFQRTHREEEDIMLSKMRQMKQSFMTNDNMRSSINSRSSQLYPSGGERSYTNEFKPDPRVQNIDKINNKIKQILNCLNQNEKIPSKYVRQQNNALTKKQTAFFGVSKRQQPNINIAPEKKTYQKPSYKRQANYPPRKTQNAEKQKIVHEERRSFNIPTYTRQLNVKKNEKDEVSILKNKAEQSINKFQQRISENTYWKNSSHIKAEQKKPQKQYLAQTPVQKQIRSKSFLDSYKKSTIRNPVDHNHELHSGKKLNQEIDRIQQKIEQFQQKKRKLNMSFTPFKTRSTSNLKVKNYRMNESFGNSETKEQQKLNKSYLERPSKYPHKQQTVKFDLNIKKSDLEQQKKSSRQIPTEKKVCQELLTVRIQNKIQNNQEESINNSIQNSQVAYFNVDQIKRTTDEGIKERQKRLNYQGQKISNQCIKQMVKLFCQQAKLDQEYRNMKIWFEFLTESNKLEKLSEILSKEFNISLSLEECEEEFTVSESENNPFFTTQGFQGTYKMLAETYIQSKTYWEKKISHKFLRQSLIKQNFSTQKIDLEKKGFIQLEDLVRFLNIESGTFFRNRDIYLIFKKFTRADKVTFDIIMKQICDSE